MPGIPQLGERGGGWVVAQFVLIGVVVLVGVVGPPWPESVSDPLSLAGLLLALVGAALAILSARALGKSLTPYPRPSAPGVFVERGPYRIVRHPIYLGGLLFLGGFALVCSPLALLATGVLAIVWSLKAHVEERFLLRHYPEYAEYCARTRYRLIPFVH